MGLIHSACLRPFSAIQTIGEFDDPEFSTYEVFQAIEGGDVDRVSRLLEENYYDLTVPDKATGDTMLHRAIACGHDDVVVRLLIHAAQDPAILNAQDACRYTPLVRAAVMKNVALMQVLFEQGGRVDDGYWALWLTSWEPGKRCGWPLAAEFLVRAQGDISEALRLAVQYRQPGIAEMYRSAGASCIPAMGLGADAIRWMSDCECIRGEDALSVLTHAQRSGNAETSSALLSSDTVYKAIYGMADQSDKSMAALIQRFYAAGADAEALVSTAVARYKQSRQAEGFYDDFDRGTLMPKGFRVLRNLISIGLPTARELANQSRCDDVSMMRILIDLGVDVPGAMLQLEASDAANLAFWALKSVLQQKGLSEANKAVKLQAIIRNGGAGGAAELACLLAKRPGPLDDVVLLIRCGATLSNALCRALVDRVHEAEHDRTTEQVPGESPERRVFRQLIDAGIDFSPVVMALHQEIASRTIPSGRHGKPTSQDALSVIRYAQLQHLLSKASLSIAEKIVEVSAMIGQDAKQAAGNLLRDAVITNHAATMKLLILAGAPATEILMELSSQLLPGETDPILKTEALVHLGADFQPALRQLMKSVEAYTSAGDLGSVEKAQEALRQLGFTVALVMQRAAVKND